MNDINISVDKSEDRLRSILDSTTDIIFLIERDFRIVEVNKCAADRLEKTKEELLGHKITDFFPIDTAEFRMQHYTRAFEEGVEIIYQSKRVGKWSETRLVPIQNSSGRIAHLSIIAKDITAQKTAEQDSIRSANTMQQFFDLGLIGMALTSPDKRWLLVNGCLCEMLGYSRDELLLMDWAELTHPDSIAENNIEMARVLAGEKDGFSLDKQYIRKDGRVLYAAISTRAIRNSNGEIEHFIVLIIDITERRNNILALQQAHDELEEKIVARTTELTQEIAERRQTEAALIESEERFRDFAFSAADSYWEFDKELKLSYLSETSPAPDFWKDNNIVGRTIDELLPDREENREQKLKIVEAFESHVPFRNMPTVEFDLNGNKLHFRRSGIPLFDSSGEFLGYRGITINVTEEFEARERAIDIEKQFINAIEHLSEGFILWDQDDRLVAFNSYFYDHMPKGIQEILVYGLHFSDFARTRAEIGQFEDAIGRIDEWVSERMLERRTKKYHIFRDRINLEKWLQYTCQLLDDGSVIELLTDITNFKNAESRLENKSDFEELLHKISASANEALTVEEAYRSSINAICEYTGWPFACVWVKADDEPSRLKSSGIIFNSDPAKFMRLEEHARNREYGPGEGKLGDMLGGEDSYWIKKFGNIEGLERSALIVECGGQGGLLIPIRVGDELAAVLEFVVEEWHEEDTLFAQSLQQIKDHLGHVVAREHAKEALQAGEEKLRDFAESAADRFWETDEEFKYSYVSPPVGRLVNTVENLLGNTPWEVKDVESNPDNWRRLTEAVENRQPFRNFQYDWVDGQGFVRHLRVSGSPYFDKIGAYKGYRGTTIDETEEIEAKTRAEDIRLRFSAAMENLEAGFVLWGPDDRLIVCNSFVKEIQPEMKNLMKPGLRYQDFVKAVAATNWAANNSFGGEEWIRQRTNDHAAPETDLEYQISDGRWFRIRKQKLRDGSTLVYHFEITNLKSREVELNKAIHEAEAANKTKSEFLANMSHELRTPLNAIIGFSDALNHGVFGDLANDGQRDYLGNIYEAGHHLLELINDILDVSAIEAGRLELHIETVSLGEAADAALRLVEHRARNQGINLINHLEDNDKFLSIDALRMKQIFVNLLSNAIKFTPQGGTVSLRVDETSDNKLAISVCDTGIGMDAAGIKKALTKFGQVQSDFSREEEGTGLGIPLTKGLVEAHGGTLEIQSNPGAGTVVIVYLPISALQSK